MPNGVILQLRYNKRFSFSMLEIFKQQFISHSLVSQSFLFDVNLSRKHQQLGFASPYWKQQLQTLALQPAVWGISCLVLLPSSCNNSSLHSSFSNYCKATAVTHIKWINRHLLGKETSFVCYTSSLLRKSRHMKQKEKLRAVAKIKTKITKIEHNYNPSTKHHGKTVQRTRLQQPFGTLIDKKFSPRLAWFLSQTITWFATDRNCV